MTAKLFIIEREKLRVAIMVTVQHATRRSSGSNMRRLSGHEEKSGKIGNEQLNSSKNFCMFYNTVKAKKDCADFSSRLKCARHCM